MKASVILALVILAACSHPPAGTLRFANAPPVWRVSDRTPLEKKPAEREYNRSLYQTDGFVVRRATRAMDMQDPVRARDVNALDEVPDSTWFTNRIGVRDLSIEELRRGANVDPSPFSHLPWTIKSAKVGGTAIGFIFEDSKGDKYLLKVDMKDVPEMETGAHVIGHRIVWALGYNVPEDYLGYIDPKNITVDTKATKKDPLGHKTPLYAVDVVDAFAKAFRTDDGRVRVLASRYLPGIPIGPYAREGVRADDPNDRIPHEQRRSIRGQAAIFSWLNHTDMQEDNTLDAFIRYPGPDGKPTDRGHVVHYLIDFGKALGVMGYVNSWKTVGYTYRADPGMALRSLLTFGLWKRPWDGIEVPTYRGLGLFEADHFDPGAWRTNSPYWPFEDADRFDGYWGAKLVMRFTREQLTAIVDEAQYSDPRTAKYMVDTLVARQRKVGAYWFRQVSPLDHFATEAIAGGTRVCFDDLALVYDLESPRGHRYRVRVFDRDGVELRASTLPASAHSCVVVPIATSNNGYTIVKLEALRNALALPPVLVHLARDASGAVRVIGVRRE
ncbi:MAG: hypothetical protein AB7L94_28930 [Kofleriaceae bacterium]